MEFGACAGGARAVSGFSLVNGHALSENQAGNSLVNFALLKTIGLKDPVRSGQQMAVYLGRLANEIGGGRPLIAVGDFRMGKRSTAETFNEDLYAFPPSYPVTAGDLGLAVPAKIMRHIWAALKKLDTIVPGVLPRAPSCTIRRSRCTPTSPSSSTVTSG